MNIEFRADRGERVVVLAGAGLGSPREWLAEINLAVVNASEGPADALLLDFRVQRLMPSEREATMLVAALRTLCGREVPPVAILANPGTQFSVARMMCTLGEVDGCRTAAFRDETAAWSWLQTQLDGSRLDASAEAPAAPISA
jgi:hypothetical protein